MNLRRKETKRRNQPFAENHKKILFIFDLYIENATTTTTMKTETPTMMTMTTSTSFESVHQIHLVFDSSMCLYSRKKNYISYYVRRMYFNIKLCIYIHIYVCVAMLLCYFPILIRISLWQNSM